MITTIWLLLCWLFRVSGALRFCLLARALCFAGARTKSACLERVYSISYFRAREKHTEPLPQECQFSEFSAKKRHFRGFFTPPLCKLFVIIGNERGFLGIPAIIKTVCKDGKDTAKQ
jgi:hypothetical protein